MSSRGVIVDRVLREREIVDLFMAAGIYESTAKDIVKSIPELNGMTEKQAEIYKQILREASSVLEKEGIPEIIPPTRIEEMKEQEGMAPRKVKINLCKICKDTAAIHPSFPENMRMFFRKTQYFRGELTKDDWLCRSCYAEWYRENRDLMQDIINGNVKYDEEKEDDAPSEQITERSKIRKKERYLKSIVMSLWYSVKYLDPKAVGHRKMLVRYIIMNQIRFNQVAAALWYLRKAGNGIIDQEDFEKKCGIGQYEDLFGFSLWKEEFGRSEILREDEAERKKRKEEKRVARERAAAEKKKQEEDEKKEAARQKQNAETVTNAEKEAEEKQRSEKWRKLKEARKKEDEDITEARKNADALRDRRTEKRENDLKKKRHAREVELRQVELALKRREEELRRKQDERQRKQRAEALARQNERKQSMLDLKK